MAKALSTSMANKGSKKVNKRIFNLNRESILKYITNNPGCTQSHIINNEGISEGTVRYHIKKLEADGNIILKRMGKSVRFFTSSHAISDKEKLIASYVSNKTDRNLLYTLLKRRSATNQELSTEFQMKKSSTYRYLKKYIENHIVEFKIEGRYKKYYLESEYETLLKKYVDKSVV